MKSEMVDFPVTMEAPHPRPGPSHAQFSTPLAELGLDLDKLPSRIRKTPDSKWS